MTTPMDEYPDAPSIVEGASVWNDDGETLTILADKYTLTVTYDYIDWTEPEPYSDKSEQITVSNLWTIRDLRDRCRDVATFLRGHTQQPVPRDLTLMLTGGSEIIIILKTNPRHQVFEVIIATPDMVQDVTALVYLFDEADADDPALYIDDADGDVVLSFLDRIAIECDKALNGGCVRD